MAVTGVQGPNTGLTNDFELSLKIFSGMILGEFNDRVVAFDKHRVKELEPGADSVQFPALGTIGTKYHAAGENLLTDVGYLQTVAQGERLIFADRELTSSIFLDKIEERIAKPAWRAEYSRVMGEALALHADEMVMRVMVAASAVAAGATYTLSKQGGGVGAAFNLLDTAAKILDQLGDIQVNFDTNNVPQTDRFAFLTPVQVNLLIRNDEGRNYIDKDFESHNGSLARGVIGMIAGFQIVKVTTLPAGAGPATADSGLDNATGKFNDYSAAITNLGMLAFQRECVGTARSVGIATESEYKIEYRGDLLVASYAMGHGILRPECAFAVFTAA